MDKVGEATRATTTIHDLPNELIVGILYRLDYLSKHKSARPVCRAWSRWIPLRMTTFGDLVGRRVVGMHVLNTGLVDVVQAWGVVSRGDDKGVNRVTYKWIRSHTAIDGYNDDAKRIPDRVDYFNPIVVLALSIEEPNDPTVFSTPPRTVLLMHDDNRCALYNPFRADWRMREVSSEDFDSTDVERYIPIGETIERIEFLDNITSAERLLQQSHVFNENFEARNMLGEVTWAVLHFPTGTLNLLMDWSDRMHPVARWSGSGCVQASA